MNANVRRLALDIGPWVWVFVGFQFAMALVVDALWLRHPSESIPLLFGFLMGMMAALLAQKWPLWRVLPVSRKEIGQARWLQAIAVPSLLLLLALATPAFIREMSGLSLPPPELMLVFWLSQAGMCVAFTVFTLLTVYLVRFLGRWAMLLLAVIVFPLVLLPTILAPLHLQPGHLSWAWAGDAIALLGAVILYFSAPHWPLQSSTPIWDTDPRMSKKLMRQPVEAANRPRGWAALFLNHGPTVALALSVALFLPLGIKLILPKPMDTKFLILFMSFLPVQIFIPNGLQFLRALRGLPLSGMSLAARLFAAQFVLFVCTFLLSEFIIAQFGEAPISAGATLLAASVVCVLLPLGLRFGPRVLQFAAPFLIILTLPFRILHSSFSVLSIVIPVALALLALEFFWTWWEITRGTNAYKHRPLAPMRWRGT